MKVYVISISETAIKQIKKLSKDTRLKIIAAILSFEIEPRPFGCKKLAGSQNTYRIRLGNYRVIYEIHEKEILVKVLKVGHRKDIYN
jgi:mRNA interferase RelE/StbE